MDDAGDAAVRLRAALDAEPEPRIGGLCLYGTWDGGRRGENWYELEWVEAEGEALNLVFKLGRLLIIHRPVGLEVWKNSITIRRVASFEFHSGPDLEREVHPPQDWPPYSAASDFEFGV